MNLATMLEMWDRADEAAQKSREPKLKRARKNWFARITHIIMRADTT